MSRFSRKEFIVGALVSVAATALGSRGQGVSPTSAKLSASDLKSFEKVIGIELKEEERAEILSAVESQLQDVLAIRQVSLPNSVAPAVVFQPERRKGSTRPENLLKLSKPTVRTTPSSEEDLAFLSAKDLAELIRTKKVSPVELTELYLERIAQFAPKLLCVVTVTEALARKQAKEAEEEIMKGRYRGPLHGLPFGIKDLFAVKDYPTTWGAKPYAKQKFPYNAAVVERLEQAGAILVAKTSVGSLAMGDVWFEGTTKNPWNSKQGSSGSSAGSASGTAAGLFAFSIGTETLGSIVSPSHQCRVTGLRPTFGRVSRFGAMALSWTMDKVGPICRTAEDCAMVFAAIHGADPRDLSSETHDYRYAPGVDFSKLKIGYVVGKSSASRDPKRLETEPGFALLQKLGAKLIPVEFPDGNALIDPILSVEGAAAFDEFTRSQAIYDLKNSEWPKIFRAARFISGVDHLQAQRARTILFEKTEAIFKEFDLIVGTDRGGDGLITTNLTGQPQVLIPFGATASGNAKSMSMFARRYDEGRLLACAKAFQDAAGFLSLRPDLSQL